jgi:hypothetical protein
MKHLKAINEFGSGDPMFDEEMKKGYDNMSPKYQDKYDRMYQRGKYEPTPFEKNLSELRRLTRKNILAKDVLVDEITPDMLDLASDIAEKRIELNNLLGTLNSKLRGE